MTTLFFLLAKNNAQKVQHLSSQSQSFFFNRKPLLILVSSFEAAHYVDLLLWSHPADGFIPHTVTDQPSSSLITISIGEERAYDAPYIFNLCAFPLPIQSSTKELYELYDETSIEKTNTTQKKWEFYKKNYPQITILRTENAPQ